MKTAENPATNISELITAEVRAWPIDPARRSSKVSPETKAT